MSNSFIEELILVKTDGVAFSYKFSASLNYFQGKNGSGKTEFFYFLDYMLGNDTFDFTGKEWYQDLQKATLVYNKNNNKYYFTRLKNSSDNYFHINEELDEKCNLQQYILFLSVIATDESSKKLKNLRNTTDVDISIRSCAAFNFLEEKGISSNPKINFLTKCSNYKYQKWVSILLDYLFHPNSSDIYKKRKEIIELKKQLKEQQNLIEKLRIYKNSINDSLCLLNSSCEFKNNTELIKKEIQKIKNFNTSFEVQNLETVYQLNTVSEKIKLLRNTSNDMNTIGKAAQNRMDMLARLKLLTSNFPEYKQFAEPLVELIQNLSNTINLTELLIKNKNEDNLKNVERKLKKSVNKRKASQSIIDLDEKIKSVAVIESLLNKYEEEYQEIDIEDTIKKLKNAEDDLDELVNSIDQNKIKKFQTDIMKLYKSAASVSPLIQSDLNHEGFILDYEKKNNSIIPSIIVYDDDTNVTEIHIEQYRGSQARSSIIQLCGYCALQLLLQEDKTIPCLPLLVIDNFSKTFSNDNVKALGCVLNKFYEMLGVQPFQTIIFEIKEAEDIDLINYTEEKLVTEYKSGFVPWINEKK